ncbi:MAG: nitrous oxide reductase family maturation protein NosD [Bacteroidia bacterium]|nr:nitrous oxide reductase family maturation protein NosD [Bacteroidia bacterium]
MNRSRRSVPHGLLLAALLVFAGSGSAAVLHAGPGQLLGSIRDAIRLAAPGDTVFVHPGFYAEGNLVVDKPLALIGIGYPVLDGQHQAEILTIQASGTRVQGFEIRNSGQMSTIDIAGIKVLAVSRVSIEQNRLFDCNFGIYLSNTVNCLVKYNHIAGTPAEEQNTGNGIHLWKCDSAAIEHNYVTGHRDGIYFEFVTQSRIFGNLSEGNIRYGLHFMFSHEDRYERNTFRRNGAGVAVMYSRKVQMYENTFEHNWGGAAYGILLKDISDSEVECSRFVHNTAGIYMEGCSRIRFRHNEFRENGWALRIQASCDANVFKDNGFYGNSFDVATNGTMVLNDFNGNFWDHYEGYDLDRDGTGDIPYRPVRLFSMIAERMPHALILMRSFMVYLLDRAEKTLPVLTPVRLLDEQPRMQPVLHESDCQEFGPDPLSFAIHPA